MTPRTRAATAGAAICAFALAGCVTATSQTQYPLSAEFADYGFVQDVNVTAEPGADISAGFMQDMEQKLHSKLANCATGERPLRVDVQLLSMKGANPLQSAVMTDTNAITGIVNIYSLEENRPVGSYSIAWENRGGLGLGGALMQTMSGAGQVSAGVGDEICRRAFKGDMTETVQQVELF